MTVKSIEGIKEFSADGFLRKRVWQTTNLHCNIYCFEAGGQNSLHMHPTADEVALCIEGRGIIMVGEQDQPFTSGDTTLIPQGVAHGFVNTHSEERMIVIVFQAPLPVAHVPVEPADVGRVIGRR